MIGYPIIYGDTISEDEDNKRFSNYVVSLLKNKRFQSHCTSVVCSLLCVTFNRSSA